MYIFLQELSVAFFCINSTVLVSAIWSTSTKRVTQLRMQLRSSLENSAPGLRMQQSQHLPAIMVVISFALSFIWMPCTNCCTRGSIAPETRSPLRPLYIFFFFFFFFFLFFF